MVTHQTDSSFNMSDSDAVEELFELGKSHSYFDLIFMRFLRNRTAVLGIIYLSIIILAAIFAPVIIHETAMVHPATDTHPEIALSNPSFSHLLGTDDVGRDELARLLYGARVSILVGFVSMAMALGIGIFVGSIAGFYGGVIDNIFMRVTDVFLAVPLYLILFVLSAYFVSGGSDSVTKVIMLIGLFSWANTARIARGEILAIREREFITAARAVDVSDYRMIVRHILPNAIGPLIVSATLLVGGNIITESTLSFFNFGIQPPNSSWGNMLAASQDYLSSNPILTWAPGIALLMTVLSFNLVGDGLRDALDPHQTY